MNGLNRVLHFVKEEKIWKQIQTAALYGIPWALFFSEALSSVLVIVFALPLLFFSNRLKNNAVLRKMWPFFLIFGLIFVSGFWSGNTERWLGLLRVNLPYLIMPVAFCLWPENLSCRADRTVTQFFWAGSVLGIYIIFLILRGGEAWTGHISQGGYLPVPVHHVRTSLFLAVGVLVGWHILGSARPAIFRRLSLGAMLILLIGLHLLAVRTGLVLAYAGTLIYFLLSDKYRGKTGILAFLGMAVVLAGAFLWSPSLSEKWKYWKEDRENMSSRSWAFYSDAMRWKSNELGLDIILEHPWLGVGMGDVKEEMTLRFLEKEDVYSDHYPHNQWLTVAAGTGMAGVVIFSFILGVLAVRQWRRDPLYLALFLIFTGSCLVENTILSSLGAIAFVTVFLISSSFSVAGSRQGELSGTFPVFHAENHSENKAADMRPPGHSL